ncbi:MAG: LacI family DNA-binding transcriptional regulator [Nocardioidaceae bacterium]|nr:LacI family DNA-binding transcriptional regulator [Nocardioidaceae bacterium]
MAPTEGRPADRAARVTAREVAALAGVSVGTVSNVVNRPDKVAPETLRRVREASERLGWTLHQGAQLLRGGRSAAIGAVVAQLNPHTIELLDVVERALDESGFVLQVATSAYRPDREMKRVELFEQQRVRGIIISPTQDYEAHLPRLRQLDIPLVMLGGASNGLCSVVGDGVTGGRLAAAHLIENGHRRIAVVGGAAPSDQVQARVSGVRLALTPDATLQVLPTTDYGISAGLTVAEHLARCRPDERPTGVVAINDSIAIGVQRGFRAAGISVPGDVAVIGYDDGELARIAPVPLTTVRVSSADLGHQAARLLLEEIACADSGVPHVHRQLRLQPELVVRESTLP